MSDSLLQTITGFLVVIMGMFLLTGIIMIFSKIMYKRSVKNTQTIIEEPEPVEYIAEISSDDNEVIASILASIEAYMQQNNIKNICNIVIKPLIRTSASSSWSQAGRIENVSKKA